MERELEKTLLEIEYAIKINEYRGNTHTQSVLEQAQEIIATCAKAARTPSELQELLSFKNTTQITRSSRDSRRKWYLKGYEDGKKSNEDWIPVHKDNVPDHEILACDKYGNELIGYLDYDSEAEEFVCESNDVIMYQIIAWMEKPEPYSQERRNMCTANI